MDLVRYPTGVSDCYLRPQELFIPENWTPQQTVPGISGTAYVCLKVRGNTVIIVCNRLQILVCPRGAVRQDLARLFEKWWNLVE